jgi:uncharacterized membrane protein YhaH (DUF805 family)
LAIRKDSTMETYSVPSRLDGVVWLGVAAFALGLVLVLVALLTLRRRPLDEIPRFLWALLIVLMPIIGPIVFFIVRPESLPVEQRRTI